MVCSFLAYQNGEWAIVPWLRRAFVVASPRARVRVRGFEEPRGERPTERATLNLAVMDVGARDRARAVHLLEGRRRPTNVV